MKKTIKIDDSTLKSDTYIQLKDEYKLIFTIIEGSEVDFGKVYNFSEGSVCIGRDKSNDIVLHDEKVSRKHSRVSFIEDDKEERVVIKDLDSTNGTFVNGEPVVNQILQTGDKVKLGSTIIRFSYSDLIEEKYRSRLYNLATLDGLTGFYNKRYIMNKLEIHNRIAKRNQRIYSLVLIDIDNFKAINDEYGHPFGDEYLMMFAHVVENLLREQDIAGRFGGEEFVIILPETDLKGALTLSERVRKKMEDSKLIHRKKVVQSTVSIGVAQFPLHGKTVTQMMKKADEAMYLAKSRGKNRVAAAK